jgi:hypothetical protein
LRALLLLAVLRDATMASSMSQQVISRPRIGVPWRTAAEEVANRRVKVDKYLRAVESAGGEGVLLSLASGSENVKREAENLDAFLSIRGTMARSAIRLPPNLTPRASEPISLCSNMRWPQANPFWPFAMGFSR